jgi:hypothetical protein
MKHFRTMSTSSKKLAHVFQSTGMVHPDYIGRLVLGTEVIEKL